MSLELELNELAAHLPEFSTPIALALGVLSLPDPQVTRRLTYNTAPQDAAKNPFIPYLYWTGPSNADLGQHASGICGTKKEDFWFWFNHKDVTQAMMWAQAVRTAVMTALPGNSFLNLRSLRLTAAIHIDCHPIARDMQVQLQANEFAVSQAVLGFTFAYQSSSS